ncbi:AsmA family protein, partial [Providencia alcalifaciens]
ASLSGSVDRGIAKIGLLAQQEPNKVPFELRASGTNIDLGNLNQWGWSGFSPQMWGDFEASLQGDLLASPLASSLNGKLTAVPLQGSRIVRTVVDGYVTSSMASQEQSTESQATPAANTYPVDGHVPTIVTQ